MFTELQIEADATDPDGALAENVEKESVQRRREWAVNIDSTSCRAHQHAAGGPLTVAAIVIRLRDTVQEPSGTA